LSATEFLRDITGNIERRCGFFVEDDKNDNYTFDVKVGYASKIDKSRVETELLIRYPQFILQKTYEVDYGTDILFSLATNSSYYGSRHVDKEILKKIKTFMTDEHIADHNKCIVKDMGLVCKCRKIKHKINHFSDDGVINNDSFKEEEEDKIFYKEDRKAKREEYAEYERMSCLHSSSTPTRAKTKNQYTLESISIENYTETAEQFNKADTDIYRFIRRSGVDFLQEKTFEINYKYSKEKTVKIYVDNEVVRELNILPNKQEVVDLSSYHYNYQRQITAIEYDKTLFFAKFVAKPGEYKDGEANLYVKILKDADKAKDLVIKLKTTKLDSRNVTLE
jgi:hypothetical protein